MPAAPKGRILRLPTWLSPPLTRTATLCGEADEMWGEVIRDRTAAQVKAGVARFFMRTRWCRAVEEKKVS